MVQLDENLAAEIAERPSDKPGVIVVVLDGLIAVLI